MTISLRLPGQCHRPLLAHLAMGPLEQVAFVLAEVSDHGSHAEFVGRELHLVAGHDLHCQTPYFVALNYEAQARLIARAWDSGLSIVEFHSHPLARRVAFSASDLSGLKEFVAHCWWRLRGRPYMAVVVGDNEVDALAWITNPRCPLAVDSIELAGDRAITPTNITLSESEV